MTNNFRRHGDIDSDEHPAEMFRRRHVKALLVGRSKRTTERKFDVKLSLSRRSSEEISRWIARSQKYHMKVISRLKKTDEVFQKRLFLLF